MMMWPLADAAGAERPSLPDPAVDAEVTELRKLVQQLAPRSRRSRRRSAEPR